MKLQIFQSELRLELDSILTYWSQNTIDDRYGGFAGQINENNFAVPGAVKGSVLNARICYAFSAAYRLTGNELHKKLAERAFDYIDRYFIDPDYGGVYWTVDHTGKVDDNKKQVYAIAFVIYAFAEWNKASGNQLPLQHAKRLYQQLRQNCYDRAGKGYFEALTRSWGPLADLRLSKKDANEAKTMNTHLHLLEAFTNLYRVWPDEGLAISIRELLWLFETYIIDAQSGHLHLFFNEAWQLRSEISSFGHDIEAGWLLQEAAEVLGDHLLVEKFRKLAIQLTDAALEGWDEKGGIWYEFDRRNNHLVTEKHWWPQAEALVGLFNAWQVSSSEKYYRRMIDTWAFIQHNMKDKTYGEWFWGVDGSNNPMPAQDKVGKWKCPYHNVRACIELINRIG